MGITSKWFVWPRKGEDAPLRLFCFPYSGAGASIYLPWAAALAPGIAACAVQLPGREARLAEPPFTRLAPLVAALEPEILPYLDRPFALFGHSMGALVAFELARSLARRGLAPAHLFVSGHGAPHLPDRGRRIHDLPEPEFVDALRRLGGTPPAVLEHAELREMLLPILRADFSVCETHAHQAGAPLDCPLTALGGLADVEVTKEELQAWQEQSCGAFTLHMFPGDHFYLHTARGLLLETIRKDLAALGGNPGRSGALPAPEQWAIHHFKHHS